ncbi:helix-turn-helix domain-containing protein [Flammeovirga kamogawensis]|uniref:Helix-turn-helix domain-containing protein n=1 Tax=Flammeovirga kamogawensis TaxID=373891 RepID=A0ABX8GS37_9BACT|nr:helix-turn-helix domain-containing protein [Flammeovirga kamogawensis]MBB6462692.1 AraC-like DNA-binding protein [Flammeovirga kamogawensis]QWG06072.1 helix-turn-helix domain-containing protein [Flammeovirga kamogawensis]TRX67905.1 helix-turn-helix domain-containing protein [Flammeovirga kamogawensis]
MKFTKETGEYLEILEITSTNISSEIESNANKLTVLWFDSDENILAVDGVEATYSTDDIIFLTEFHKVEIKAIKHAKLLRFNRPFYCISEHDGEVGCKGLLFFGSANLPFIHISAEDKKKLGPLWDVFLNELQSEDEHQLEMLQMLLKRLLILCTRIYKSQTDIINADSDKLDLVRNFNYLVETHFKTKHTVAEYADLLNKSPKTLSNVFKLFGHKKPLQFIQDRIVLEAKRQVIYTDKSISEIGYELGFDDVQTFSRYFKKIEGVSPTDYKQTKKVS